MVMIMIVFVTPGPIFLLLITVQSAEVAIFVMILNHPLMVINALVIVPAVVVMVVGIVVSIGSSRATSGYRRCEKSGCQKERTQAAVSIMHGVRPPCTASSQI